MSTAALNKTIEPGWNTYLKGVVFVLPAIIAWIFACVTLVPKVKDLWFTAQLEPSRVGWLWDAPMLLVEYGRLLCYASIFGLVLIELFNRGWARHRRATVSVLVWVVNVAVIVGLATLLILVLIAVPSLAHAK